MAFMSILKFQLEMNSIRFHQLEISEVAWVSVIV